MFLYQGFHAGVFLDIFPIDNWKLEEGREAYARIHQLALENSTYMRLTNPNLDEKDKEKVANWCRKDPVKAFDEINEIASQYQDEDTPYYAQPVCPLGGYEKQVLPIHLLADSMLIDFEGFTFPVPVAYHEILTVSYGDYMQFPPVEQRGLCHSNAIVLPDVPYAVALEDYMKRNE